MDQLLTEYFMDIVVDGLTGPWYCDTHPDDLDCPSKVGLVSWRFLVIMLMNGIEWLTDWIKVNETIREGLPILAEEMFTILDSGEVGS